MSALDMKILDITTSHIRGEKLYTAEINIEKGRAAGKCGISGAGPSGPWG